MAITGTYTILMRRGDFSDFVPEKLRTGEWAVVLNDDPNVTDGRALYHCFASGIVKRIATIDDMEEVFGDMTEDIVSDLTNAVNAAVELANQATQYANNAGNEANNQAELAEAAANTANAVASDLTNRLNNGEFDGPVGPQGAPGNDGANGVVTTLEGQIAFQVRDGRLYAIYYDGTTPPDVYIDENGHLKWDIQ